jgi:glycerol-3-phosphate acyltransferase PlsY
MTPWPISIPVAYLLGSIPFGYLLVRFFRKEDIREIGSGNIGATNVLRSGAKWLGIATLALDAGKGYAAVIFARHLGLGDYRVEVAAAVAAVVGHVFPVWLGFRGGKGVASGLGVFLALAPWAGLCGIAVFAAIVLLTRYVSVASIVATALMPFFALYFEPVHTLPVIAGFAFIAVLLIAKHHQNIARLSRGTENRLGAKREVEA